MEILTEWPSRIHVVYHSTQFGEHRPVVKSPSDTRFRPIDLLSRRVNNMFKEPYNGFYREVIHRQVQFSEYILDDVIEGPRMHMV